MLEGGWEANRVRVQQVVEELRVGVFVVGVVATNKMRVAGSHSSIGVDKINDGHLLARSEFGS